MTLDQLTAYLAYLGYGKYHSVTVCFDSNFKRISLEIRNC